MLGAKRVDLETLLKESDFISIHTPLSEKTKHLIGAKELSLMKKTAYLINTARGAVIDEAALVNALRNKQIAGAGLDVYEEEPKLKPGLAELDNVVLAPHLGSATVETRTKMAVMAAENIIAVLNKAEAEKLCKSRSAYMIKIRKAKDTDFEDIWEIFHQVVKGEIPLPLIQSQIKNTAEPYGCRPLFTRMLQN